MESIIDSVKSLDLITVHNPFFLIYTQFLSFCPPKIVFFFIWSIFGPRKNAICLQIFLRTFLWNLNILKILKKSLMESIIDSVKSLDQITVHNPFFSHLYPIFCLFAPKKLHFALTHLPSLHFFFTVGTI